MEAGAACRRRYELPVTDLSAARAEPPELTDPMDPDLMDLDPVDRWCVLARADRGDGRQKLDQPPRAALDSRDTRSPDRPRIGSTSCDSRLAPEAAAADPPAD